MLPRQSLLTTAPTRQHAEWAAQAFRRHEAFRDGEITVAPPSSDDDSYLVLYTGPARTPQSEPIKPGGLLYPSVPSPRHQQSCIIERCDQRTIRR